MLSLSKHRGGFFSSLLSGRIEGRSAFIDSPVMPGGLSCIRVRS